MAIGQPHVFFNFYFWHLSQYMPNHPLLQQALLPLDSSWKLFLWLKWILNSDVVLALYSLILLILIILILSSVSPFPDMILSLLVLTAGLVAAQDTYSCPDGWMKEVNISTNCDKIWQRNLQRCILQSRLRFAPLQEDRSGCRCFLFGPDEAVTRTTADLICAGHSGSWVAELDHPGMLFLNISMCTIFDELVCALLYWCLPAGINYWLKSQVLSQIPVGERASFWLGGRTEGYHSDHQPGTWTWDHMNETIEWWVMSTVSNCLYLWQVWLARWGTEQLWPQRELSRSERIPRPLLPNRKSKLFHSFCLFHFPPTLLVLAWACSLSPSPSRVTLIAQFRDYFWNDMNCDSPHHYICENRCAELWIVIILFYIL